MNKQPQHASSNSVEAALAREMAAGVRLAVIVRLLVLAVVALWTEARLGLETGSYYLLFITLFALLGVAQWFISRKPGKTSRLIHAALIAADMLLLSFILTQPPPGAPETWPQAMQLRLGNHDFLFVFVALSVLTYTPGLALWTGLSAAFAWVLAVLNVLNAPESFTVLNPAQFREIEVEALLSLLLDKHYVSTVLLTNQTILIIVITSILSVAVWRSRRLLFKQVHAASERANLARYFSPNLLPTLTRSDRIADTVQNRPAAVLFADIVGFTRISEGQTPEQTIAMLRDFHGLMAASVFDHGGTLHKFIGDAVMATFGAIQQREDDAAAALQGARTMLERLQTWNINRTAAGEPPISIGIGIHYGPVVLGNIGDAQCLEFAVLGDTVNVASRLESLCRSLNASITLSDAAYQRALEADPTTATQGLTDTGSHELRGRDQPIHVLMLPRPPV